MCKTVMPGILLPKKKLYDDFVQRKDFLLVCGKVF